MFVVLHQSISKVGVKKKEIIENNNVFKDFIEVENMTKIKYLYKYKDIKAIYPLTPLYLKIPTYNKSWAMNTPKLTLSDLVKITLEDKADRENSPSEKFLNNISQEIQGYCSIIFDGFLSIKSSVEKKISA